MLMLKLSVQCLNIQSLINMKQYKFTTQYNFDAENSDKHAHSDEVITIPDDSFTIQELMERAIANTLPPLTNHYDDDYNDDDISFEDDLAFFQPDDFQELLQMREQLDTRIAQLNEQIENEVNLAQQKEARTPNDEDKSE